MRTRIALSLSSLVYMLAAFPASAAELTAAPQTTITVLVDGIGCSTSAGSNTVQALAWNFGASDPQNGGSTSASRAQTSSVNLTKVFDSCSAALFQAVMSGKHFKDVVLTQSDANKTVMTVKLSGSVIVTGYQIAGTTSNGQPSETISFGFTAIQIIDAHSGASAGWDLTKNAAF